MQQITKEDIIRFLKLNSIELDIEAEGNKKTITHIPSENYDEIAQKLLDKVIYPVQ